MAGTFDKYQEALDQFNSKYGVNFSFEKYETRVLQMRNLQSNFAVRSKDKVENTIYKGAFTNLYRECLDNMMERKIDVIGYADLLGDFDLLMDNYREYCKENGKKAPAAKGGWKNDVEVIEAIEEKIKDVKDDIGEHTKEKYLSGKLRLRDMRASLEAMKNGETVSKEQLATAIAYQKALKSTVKERNFFWKVFHPIRNSAEQRDLKAIETFLDGERNKDSLKYSDAVILASKKTVTNVKTELSNAKKALQANAISDSHEKVEENRVRLDSEQLGADVNGKDVNNKAEKVEEHEAPKLENVKQ